MAIVDSKNQNIDEWQEEKALSAAIAAVFMYIDQENEDTNAIKTNSWMASQYMSFGNPQVKIERPMPDSINKNVWFGSSFKFLPLIFLQLLIWLTLSMPAQANEKVVLPIRVGLLIGVNNLDIDVQDGMLLQDPQRGITILNVPAHSRLTFLASTSGILAKVSNIDKTMDLGMAGNFMLTANTDDGLFGINGNGKLYRGALLIRQSNNNSSLNAINVLDIEEYLLSVVPSEMPSSWPIEALKAQAIAARSYAMANLKKHDIDGYDLKANIEDQVYVGVSSEAESTNRAVAETTGLILKYQGQVISAFFHSASGGFTESSEHVWGKDLAFLKAVPDYDDQSPYFTWQQKIKVGQVEVALAKSGNNVGSLLGMYVIDRTTSMRSKYVLVVGSDAAKLLSGEDIRRALGLPSCNFNLGPRLDEYLIVGRGFGHGLGLSQWGAKTLAENGYNAAQILTYYYKDVSLECM